MQDLLLSIGLAIVVFISTNLDDILIVSVFFAERSRSVRAIVAGQFLGIGALVFFSAVAGAAALAIPAGWVDLLGVFALLLGIRGLVELFRTDAADEEAAVVEQEHALESRLHSQILAVAAVTIANGGDNLGVYIPMFAKSPASIPLYAIVFVAMTGLWCLIGYRLVRNRLVGERISKCGRFLLPLVLIALGLGILSGATVLLS